MNMKQLSEKEVNFSGIDIVVELFDSPIGGGFDDFEIEDCEDLFFSSGVVGGYLPFYFPTGSTVSAKFEDGEEKIQSSEFIDWQLLNIDARTLLFISAKCDTDLSDVLDEDEETARDEDYDPDIWLSEYEPDTLDKGVALIERMRAIRPEGFCNTLRAAISDPDTGLTSWWETDIVSDFQQGVSKYDEWDVKVMVVSEGEFFPYFPGGGPETNLHMDDYKLRRMFIRNYDEGDI